MKRCTVTSFPLRALPEHRSEMVSQILYGEKFTILKKKDTWWHIQMQFDGYEGWVDGIPCEESSDSNSYPSASAIMNYNGKPLSMGSEIPVQSDGAKGIKSSAMELLGTPYLWGGRTFAGLDCSGFTQVVFKANGISLPRDASQQVNLGEEISRSQGREGDLVFFITDKNKVTHVGILIDPDAIIHASQQVKIDQLTDEGIVNKEGKVTHRLYKVKRVL